MRRARKGIAALVAACAVAMAIGPAGASAFFFFPHQPPPQQNPPPYVYTGGYGGGIPDISPVNVPPNNTPPAPAPSCAPILHLFGVC